MKPAFNLSRFIGVEQMQAAPVDELAGPHGQMSEEVFTGEACERGFGAFSALRVQFAMPGYQDDLRMLYGVADDFSVFTARLGQGPTQFSVWDVASLGPCLIVSNDKANYHADHLQVLPLEDSMYDAPLAQAAKQFTVEIGGLEVSSRMMLALKSAAPNAAYVTLKLEDLSAEGIDASRELLRKLFGLPVP